MKKKSKQKKEEPQIDLNSVKEELTSFLAGFKNMMSPQQAAAPLRGPDDVTWFPTLNNEHTNPEALMAKAEQAHMIAEALSQRVEVLFNEISKIKAVLSRAGVRL